MRDKETERERERGDEEEEEEELVRGKTSVQNRVKKAGAAGVYLEEGMRRIRWVF